VLEQIESWPSRPIKSDDLAIDHGILWKIGQGFEDVRILSVELFPFSGNEAQLAFQVDGDSPVSIKFDFVDPLWTFRQFRYCQTLHGFNESCLTDWQRVCGARRVAISLERSKCEKMALAARFESTFVPHMLSAIQS
jgi:hypothetical protein